VRRSARVPPSGRSAQVETSSTMSRTSTSGFGAPRIQTATSTRCCFCRRNRPLPGRARRRRRYERPLRHRRLPRLRRRLLRPPPRLRQGLLRRRGPRCRSARMNLAALATADRVGEGFLPPAECAPVRFQPSTPSRRRSGPPGCATASTRVARMECPRERPSRLRSRNRVVRQAKARGNPRLCRGRGSLGEETRATPVPRWRPSVRSESAAASPSGFG